MILKDFILNYKKAFGEKVELPLAFWYSDYAIAQTDKKGSLYFFPAECCTERLRDESECGEYRVRRR